MLQHGLARKKRLSNSVFHTPTRGGSTVPGGGGGAMPGGGGRAMFTTAEGPLGGRLK